MKEKAIETQIKSFLRYHGAWAQKVHSGAIMKSYTRKTGFYKGMSQMYRVKLADEGTPDLLACVKGKFLAIEVKNSPKEVLAWKRSAETDRRSAAQHFQQDSIREAGGFTLVVSSVDELEEDLRELNLIS